MSKDEQLLDKSSEYHKFLNNIIEYNNILKIHNNNLKTIVKDDLLIFSNLNEYFYFFQNDFNINAYFFKEKNSDEHQIYFNGINNFNDIKTIINILINNFNYENIEELIHKEGDFYMIQDTIEKLNDDLKISVLDVFDILFKNIYKLDMKNDKINLKINGYSLGGPISQVFVYILNDKYKDILNISVYNIESWFACNKENYDEFFKNYNLINIYNKKSILYFYNIIFQKYNKVSYFIENTTHKYDNVDIYIENIFPKGIIEYIKNYHLLPKILKN
jgi:hypothetical protein